MKLLKLEDRWKKKKKSWHNTVRISYDTFLLLFWIDDRNSKYNTNHFLLSDPEDYNFIELTAKDACLQSTVRKFNHECAMKIDEVKIVGVREKIAKVSISILQTKHSLSFNMDEETKVRFEISCSLLLLKTTISSSWLQTTKVELSSEV